MEARSARHGILVMGGSCFRLCDHFVEHESSLVPPTVEHGLVSLGAARRPPLIGGPIALDVAPVHTQGFRGGSQVPEEELREVQVPLGDDEAEKALRSRASAMARLESSRPPTSPLTARDVPRTSSARTCKSSIPSASVSSRASRARRIACGCSLALKWYAARATSAWALARE